VINFHTNYVAAIDAPDVHEQFREILSKIQAMVAAGETSCVTLSEAAQHLRIDTLFQIKQYFSYLNAHCPNIWE
jgi:hypothetical protein